MKIIALGAVLVAGAAIGSVVTVPPAQDSFCGTCGARKETHSLGIRFTSLRPFHLSRVSATPFSALLEEKHLVAAHRHHWQSAQLVPDPLNEFAPPVVVSLEFINAPRVVNFMRNVADYADPIGVAKWKGLVMTPEYTRVIDDSLRFMQVPVAGFANRTSFLTWWGQNSFAVYNRLREVTEPD